MLSRLNWTSIAIAVFTLAGAVALGSTLFALLIRLKWRTIFPNDFIFDAVILLVTAVPAYVIGKLLFQEWKIQFSLKLILALGVILAFGFLSNYVVMTVSHYTARGV